MAGKKFFEQKFFEGMEKEGFERIPVNEAQLERMSPKFSLDEAVEIAEIATKLEGVMINVGKCLPVSVNPKLLFQIMSNSKYNSVFEKVLQKAYQDLNNVGRVKLFLEYYMKEYGFKVPE